MTTSRSAYDGASGARARNRLLAILLAAAGVVLIAAIVVLGVADIAPDRHTVEKVVPNDRLSR